MSLCGVLTAETRDAVQHVLMNSSALPQNRGPGSGVQVEKPVFMHAGEGALLLSWALSPFPSPQATQKSQTLMSHLQFIFA